ncbi:MAG: peptidyl-prolyl cis-trans isomerase [Candidatus Eisenbacteria bacterium]|nr:peptidyl-prolyl cis-trans isomerase [Candidatus Eisenbacteria bacterium]
MSRYGIGRVASCLPILLVVAAIPRPPLPTIGRGRAVDLPVRLMRADTILAEVEPGRRISVGDFRRGWVQVDPPSRPDSLTPEAARQFLDLLVDKEVLAGNAVRERWVWSPLESAQVANLRDRTIMGVALDSALLETAKARAAKRDSALGTEALGIAARESTVARMHVTYDETLLERMTQVWGKLPRVSSDSSFMARLRIMGQLPPVEPADEARVIAWSTTGTLKIADLLDSWKKLNPLFRPRIQSPDQMRDLVKNGLFERALRRQATLRRLDRDPRVLDAVRRQGEFFDVQYYVAREVYETIPQDSLTLRRRFDQDPTEWAIPERIRLLRLVLPDRIEAVRMAVKIRDRAEAETLLTRGIRQRVNYGIEISAATDSALFRRAKKAGVGEVLGPDAVRDGYEILRVNEILPQQARTFDEAVEFVRRAWAEDEGERRMQALLAKLRKATVVTVNDAALARLVREGIPRPKRASGTGS